MPFLSGVRSLMVSPLVCLVCLILYGFHPLYGGTTLKGSPINNELVRGQWGWEGAIISDCGAIYGFETFGFQHSPGHNYTGTGTDTCKAALVQGGCDCSCDMGGVVPFYTAFLPAAIKAGVRSSFSNRILHSRIPLVPTLARV
jgi:beta-glucosidase-like glycosyl hydrolase